MDTPVINPGIYIYIFSFISPALKIDFFLLKKLENRIYNLFLVYNCGSQVFLIKKFKKPANETLVLS